SVNRSMRGSSWLICATFSESRRISLSVVSKNLRNSRSTVGDHPPLAVEPSRDPHLPRPTLPDHISQRSSSPSVANRGGDRPLVRSQSTRHYTISVLPVSRKRMPALTQGSWRHATQIHPSPAPRNIRSEE